METQVHIPKGEVAQSSAIIRIHEGFATVRISVRTATMKVDHIFFTEDLDSAKALVQGFCVPTVTDHTLNGR